MKSSTITWIIIIIIVLGGGWYLYSGKSSPTPAPVVENTTVTTTDSSTATTTATTAPMTATVTYGPNGFSPATVTIAAGGTVTFVDQGGPRMWVASDPHPTHEGYDGTTRSQHCATGYTGAAPFDQCTASTTYTFTFQKTGSWGYHNHANESDKGTVVVQ